MPTPRDNFSPYKVRIYGLWGIQITFLVFNWSLLNDFLNPLFSERADFLFSVEYLNFSIIPPIIDTAPINRNIGIAFKDRLTLSIAADIHNNVHLHLDIFKVQVYNNNTI